MYVGYAGTFVLGMITGALALVIVALILAGTNNNHK